MHLALQECKLLFGLLQELGDARPLFRLVQAKALAGAAQGKLSEREKAENVSVMRARPMGAISSPKVVLWEALAPAEQLTVQGAGLDGRGGRGH